MKWLVRRTAVPSQCHSPPSSRLTGARGTGTPDPERTLRASPLPPLREQRPRSGSHRGRLGTDSSGSGQLPAAGPDGTGGGSARGPTGHSERPGPRTLARSLAPSLTVAPSQVAAPVQAEAAAVAVRGAEREPVAGLEVGSARAAAGERLSLVQLLALRRRRPAHGAAAPPAAPAPQRPEEEEEEEEKKEEEVEDEEEEKEEEKAASRSGDRPPAQRRGGSAAGRARPPVPPRPAPVPQHRPR